jgi:hypothetical protein
MGSQRETLKPFSVIVSSVAYETNREVGLSGTQTEGGIYCNYVSVQDITTGAAPADVSFFVVAPSSIQYPYTEAPQGYSANNINVSALEKPEVNGAGARGGGSVVAGQGSIATLNLPEATACKSITIRNDLGYTAAFAVTYGVVSMSNPLRDGRQNKGS